MFDVVVDQMSVCVRLCRRVVVFTVTGSYRRQMYR
jgi:hypothetical protein